MTTCVPIRDLRDTAAFDELVVNNMTPVIVTKNGYDRFVCMNTELYERYEQAEAKSRLLERMLIAEKERDLGLGEDAFEVLARIEEEYGL